MCTCEKERETYTHTQRSQQKEERAHGEEIEVNPMKLLEVKDRDT